MTELLFGIVVVTIGIYLATLALSLLRLLRKPVDHASRPSVSLIRTICGVDRFDRQTLGSSFTQHYADYEVLLCAASEDDPAVELARDLVAHQKYVPARVLVGDTAISGNPKLNNLVKGVEKARGDVLVMADSNLMLTPDYLSNLADTWTPGTGLVSAPAYGAQPENFWGALECAFLNGSQARWQLAGDAVGQGFAQGKTLAWRRDVLENGGGLMALGRDLAEDVASTKLVRRQGLRVRLPRKLFAQPIGKRSFRQVWDRQLRWSRIRRAGFPLIFALEIVQGPALPALALTALAVMGAVPWLSLAALPVLWYGAELALARIMGWPAALRDLGAMIARDALLAPVWFATFASRDFAWRGTAMGDSSASRA